jgi:hypothetical protein
METTYSLHRFEGYLLRASLLLTLERTTKAGLASGGVGRTASV